MEHPAALQRSSASSKLSENLAILRELKMEPIDSESAQSMLDYNISSPCPSQMMQNINHANPQMSSLDCRNFNRKSVSISHLQQLESQNLNPDGTAPTIRSRLVAIREALGEIKTEIEGDPQDPVYIRSCRSYGLPSPALLSPPARPSSYQRDNQNLGPGNPSNPSNLPESASTIRLPGSSYIPYHYQGPSNQLQSSAQMYPAYYNPTYSAGPQNSLASSISNMQNQQLRLNVVPQSASNAVRHNSNLGSLNSSVSEMIDLTEDDCGGMQERMSSFARIRGESLSSSIQMSSRLSQINAGTSTSGHRPRAMEIHPAGLNMTGVHQYSRHSGPHNVYPGSGTSFIGNPPNLSSRPHYSTNPQHHSSSGTQQSISYIPHPQQRTLPTQNYRINPQNPIYIHPASASNVPPSQQQLQRSEPQHPVADCSVNQLYRPEVHQSNPPCVPESNPAQTTQNPPQNHPEPSNPPPTVSISSILHNLVSIDSYFQVTFHHDKFKHTAVKYDKSTIKYCRNYFLKAKKMFAKCEICKLDRRDYRNHCRHRQDIDLDVLMTFGIHYCDYDGRMFRRKSYFIQHMMSHITVKCPECDREMKESGLATHMKYYHTDDGEYKCKSCPRVFKNKQRLNIHEDIHEKKFECQICNWKFSKKITLKEHFNAYHNDDKKAQVRCPICDKKITRKNSLKQHMLIHDTTTPKRFKCDRCDFSTHMLNSFKIHKRSHVLKDKKYAELENPLKCSKCPAHLRNEQALRNHMMNVHPKAVYSCDMCGRVIRVKSNLMKHIRIHVKNWQGKIR